MEKEYFIQLILRLNSLKYNDVEKTAVLKTLAARLKEVDESRKKLILYVFLNFRNFEEINFLVETIKNFEEERLSALETIIAIERTDYYNDNDIDSCKKIIEIAKSIDKNNLRDLINILEIAQCICHNDKDKFKFALMLINNFNIRMFSDARSLGQVIYNLDQIMDLDSHAECSQYNLNAPYLTIPREVDLDTLDSKTFGSYQFTLGISKKHDDDDSRSNLD